MAGDWIKIRCDLPDDPAVISMATDLGLDEDAVVGRLVRLWRWANRHTKDGNVRGVTPEWLDHYLNTPGFSLAISKVGWLTLHDGGVQFPNFGRHNGQTSKARALTAIRVALHRDGDSLECNAATVTEALPEKRREEKRKTTANAVVAPPNSPPKAPRAPDPLWDAIVEVTGVDPSIGTTAGFIGRVRKELSSAATPYTPEEVRAWAELVRGRGLEPSLGYMLKDIGTVRTAQSNGKAHAKSAAATTAAAGARFVARGKEPKIDP